MRITAFNGSPMGASGNTNVMVAAFLEGAEEVGAEVENIFLADKEINHCKACYYCYSSGGKCSIDDDMGDLMSKFVESDIVVLATPLYVFNVSGIMKAFMDRSICIGNLGFEKDEDGIYKSRLSKHFKNGIPPKLVVIASGTRPDRANFQELSLLMKRVAKKGWLTELAAEIYATEGDLLTAGAKELEPIINGYKELLHKAGQEIVKDMKLLEETQKLLERNLIPADIFVQLVNEKADMILAGSKNN
jgi:multimeric flavodoxin WrbA